MGHYFLVVVVTARRRPQNVSRGHEESRRDPSFFVGALAAPSKALLAWLC